MHKHKIKKRYDLGINGKGKRVLRSRCRCGAVRYEYGFPGTYPGEDWKYSPWLNPIDILERIIKHNKNLIVKKEKELNKLKKRLEKFRDRLTNKLLEEEK